MNRVRMIELAKELGFRQISVEDYRFDLTKRIPAGTPEDYRKAMHRWADARVAYDQAFAQWAREGFPE